MRGKKSTVKKSHKPWGGDLPFPRKPYTTWFNDILVACLSLPGCLERMGFAAFSKSWSHQAAAMRHIWQIGEAASRQPASVRRQHPVDWKALVHLKERMGISGGEPAMTPRQIWNFVRKDVPVLQEKLADDEGLLVAQRRLRDRDRLSIKEINRLLREGRRRRKRKDARAAAEARSDARLARIAERRLAKFEAGHERAIPSAEMWERLGLGPREDKPQAPYSHRYHFVFWQEDGIWSAKAPSVRGAYGVGPTAGEVKDDLIQALEALSEHLKKSGENMKAAVCDRLVATWKTSKPRPRRK
jgi:uncharacterized protein with HEPN domain/predicted RNase H-like HicB family nuclease